MAEDTVLCCFFPNWELSKLGEPKDNFSDHDKDTHESSGGVAPPVIDGLEDLSRADAKAVEQVLIERYGRAKDGAVNNMAKRVKIGDLVEMPIEHGDAYAQYTHKHARYGALLRVFSEVYPAGASDLESVIEGKVQFSIFCQLQSAINDGFMSVVSNLSIKDEHADFPLFRSGFVDPFTRKVGKWWFLNGNEGWQVGTITEEQKNTH